MKTQAEKHEAFWENIPNFYDSSKLYAIRLSSEPEVIYADMRFKSFEAYALVFANDIGKILNVPVDMFSFNYRGGLFSIEEQKEVKDEA
jgi:hypothetical protein